MKSLYPCYDDADKFAAPDAAAIEAIGPACRPHDAAQRACDSVESFGS